MRIILAIFTDRFESYGSLITFVSTNNLKINIMKTLKIIYRLNKQKINSIFFGLLYLSFIIEIIIYALKNI